MGQYTQRNAYCLRAVAAGTQPSPLRDSEFNRV